MMYGSRAEIHNGADAQGTDLLNSCTIEWRTDKKSYTEVVVKVDDAAASLLAWIPAISVEFFDSGPQG